MIRLTNTDLVEGAPSLSSSTRRGTRSFGGLGVVAVTLPLVSLACGGGAAPEPETPVAPPPSVAPAPEPLVVAAEPEDLVVVGRIRNPGPLLDKLGEWAKVPLPWQSLLTEQYPHIQEVLVPNAPIDFAVGIDPESKSKPEVLAIVSLPLSDYTRGVDALKASGQPNSTDAEGQPYVTLKGNTECTVARATGPTSARLVCGDHVSLERLASFAATNLPNQAIGNSDLYAELRFRPVYARYGKRATMLKMMVPMALRELSLNNARFDAALAEAAHATADDVLQFISEADKLTVEFSLNDQTQEANGEVGFLFSGSKSFLASAVAHSSKSEGAPPAAFWSLPSQSSSATFTAQSTPFERLKGMSETLGELAGGALEHAGLAGGVIDTWVAEVKKLINSAGARVVAHVPSPGDRSTQTFAASLGCDVGAIEGDAGSLVQLLDSTVKVFNDPKLRAELSRPLKLDFKKLPTVGVKQAPARLGLPSGTKVYTVTLPADIAKALAEEHVGEERAKKQGPLTLQVIVVSQAERTWVSWGADEAHVVSTLKQVLSGDASKSLAQNPAFARWRNARVASGMTFQLKEALKPSLLSSDSWLTEEEAAVARRAMPHGGASYNHAEYVADAEGPRARLKLAVPRASLEDLSALFASFATRDFIGTSPSDEANPDATAVP